MNKEIQEFKEHIEKIINLNILVIVEGKKDMAALNKFGITNIIELTKGPLYKIVEEVADTNKECIILTDLDKKGKELYGKLNSDLQKRGVKVDNNLRNFLFKNTKIRQIEGINNVVE